MIPLQKNIQHSPQEVYQLLQDVTRHIVSWAKPGMKMCELDAEARRMLGEYSEYFTHSLGHGVGIQIHESPRVSGKSREILEPGMVITIEPGVYFGKKHNAQSTKHKEGILSRYPELVLGSTHDDLVYGLRYEEMVLVDKYKLTVL